MRTILLTSTAAVCLMLAGQVAQAQTDEHGKKHEQKVEQSQQPPAAQAPKHAAEHKQRPSTTGQATEDKPKKDETSAAPENKDRDAKKDEKGTRSERNAQSNSDKERHKSASEQKPSEAKKSNAGNDTKSTDKSKAANETKSNESKSKAASGQEKSNTASDQNKTNTATDQNKTATDQNKTNTATDQNKAPTSAQAPKGSAQSKQENAKSPNDNSNVNASDKTNNTNVNATNDKTGRNASTNVNISQDQKVKISERIQRDRDLAPPVRNVDVSITVGQRVPSRIRLHPLPTTIVTIAPEYRGYEYFTTEEDVVIVSPRTHEIVTRIPRDVSRARAESGSGSSTGNTTVTSVSSGGSPPCQVFRRTASGDLNPVDPAQLRQTTGAGSSPDRLAVKVQAPNGQQMPEVTLPDQQGRIIAETDGNGCRIILEPGQIGR